MRKDKIFNTKLKKVPKFEFNEKVADVFDDMVSRSVPYYHEIHRMLSDLMVYKLKESDRVYDLGCSTGTTLALVHQFARAKGLDDIALVGVDNSPSMIEKAAQKLSAHGAEATLLCAPIEEVELDKCGMVVMNYTLQFIPAPRRKALVKKIYKSLRPGGIFVMSEKIKSPTPAINSLTIDMYHDFKRRNGYSDLEISQKREALENVLIPWTADKQLALLKDSGFKKSEMLFRWYNFASFIGVK